ncbi:MAG: hypothetical protein JW704_02360 [Anaerolineaceae bacterium]|nr:hypothetical protein [Anaerolineaceae bacterium]MBN2676819.1 hypothetical protein [Anaerolineaceae bacterium]
MRPRSYPEPDRLSILMAAILLAYTLARFINLPPLVLDLSLFGIELPLKVNFQTLVALVVAIMAASGSIWLISDHPVFKGITIGWRNTLQIWLLPALTAFLLSVPLNFVASSPAWWAVFLVGACLLVLVFIAEYAVVDVSDVRHPASTGLLIALSFALFLIMAIAIRAASLRLYLMVPAVVFTSGLVSLHALYLRLEGRWMTWWAIGIALMVGQIAIGLYYWPLTATRFGLVLLGLGYALTGLAAAIEDRLPLRQALIEPLSVLGATWVIALLIT